MMPGKYPGLRALLWHFNGYYDSPDILCWYFPGIVITGYIVVTHIVVTRVL
jgi:hypothetical protein